MIKWLLLGPNAVGKSTLGAWLAPRLQLGFADLDQVLSQSFQTQNLAACLQEWGPELFHRRSMACLAELAQSAESWLVAVGAGSQWANQGRQDLLRYPTIWLEAKAEQLWVRNQALRQDPRSLEQFRAIEYAPEREFLARGAALCIDLSDKSLPMAQQLMLETLLAFESC